MDGAAPDAIYRVSGITIPSLQAERALSFAARAVQRAPPTREFVPDREDAGGILVHSLVECLRRGVVYNQPAQFRLRVRSWAFRALSALS